MLNRIILMGRLAADPELRTTPNGVSVASFRIGVTRDYNRDQTDWINIVAWRQTAEFVSKYFFKGNMIALEGSLQSRQYQDRDGNNRTAYEVQADRVWFAESKGGRVPSGRKPFCSSGRTSRCGRPRSGQKRQHLVLGGRFGRLRGSGRLRRRSALLIPFSA